MKGPIAFAGVALALILAGCGHGGAPIDRAALLSAKGRDLEAIAVLEGHLRDEPGAVAERRMLLRLYGVVGRLDQSERVSEDLCKWFPPGSPVPAVELGAALELNHRYDEALAAYDHAAELAPTDPLGPATGGLRAARWGEVELARPRLEEALRRDSRRADLWHALGLVRLHLGDLEGAQSAYEKGLIADPGALENRLGLATVALKRGAPRSALRQYDLVVHRRPQFADARLGRALALILLGRLPEAEVALREAERLGGDPDVVAAQRRLITRLEEKRESQQNR